MLTNILIAQSKKELKFLISKNLKNVKIVPLNLETLIFCKINKLEHIDLQKFLDNSIHKFIISQTEQIFKNASFSYSKYESLNTEFLHWFRFRVYSYLFVNLILKKILKNIKVKNIWVSGWNDMKNLYSKDNYFLSYYLKGSFKKVIPIQKIKSGRNSVESSLYYVDKKDQTAPIGKKTVILNNLDYNFKRLAFWFFKNNYQIIVFSFNKYNFFKKFFVKFLNIRIIQVFSKRRVFKKKIIFPKLYFKKKRIDNLIIQDKEKLSVLFNNIENKALAIKNFIDKSKIFLATSNIYRGIDGTILEICKQNNIPTLNIPHGTLSMSYNKFDSIYKKNISEAIIYKRADTIVSQSKISDKFFKQFKIKKNLLSSNNVVFTEVKKDTKCPYVLYAVTNKDFQNMQFYGVETFYEFYENLKNLENISLKYNLKIIVKPHPTEFNSIKDLMKLFPNLIFSKEDNAKLFKKIFATVTFSSSIIEDSLNSGIPVILFDKRSRYVHCESETKLNKFAWVYYVENNKNFIKCLKKIEMNKERYNFMKKKDYRHKQNIDKLLKNVLNEKQK